MKSHPHGAPSEVRGQFLVAPLPLVDQLLDGLGQRQHLPVDEAVVGGTPGLTVEDVLAVGADELAILPRLAGTVVLQGGTKVLALPVVGFANLLGHHESDLPRADVAVGVAQGVDGTDDRLDTAVLLVVGVDLDGVEPAVVVHAVVGRDGLEHVGDVVLVREHDLVLGQLDHLDANVGAAAGHVNDRGQCGVVVDRGGSGVAERLLGAEQLVGGPTGSDGDENCGHEGLLGWVNFQGMRIPYHDFLNIASTFAI